MPTHADSPGGGSGRREPFIARLWTRGVDGLAVLGTLMIVVLMIMICADVIARNLLGGSLPLISELGALTLVMIVYLQLGAAVRNDRMARTDMFLSGLARSRPRAGAIVSGLWDLAGAAVCVGIAYSTLGIFQRDYAHGDFIGVTGVLTLPTWPFRLLILVGITAAMAQFLVRALDAFRRAARPAEDRP
jgi:TRAP-type C4-dicarboxylate transport system permease small subunit